ncbi:MAG: Holliday junction resolvase RuvX, partial [Rubricella sp.]
LQTLPRGRFGRDLERIETLLASRGVTGFVIGLPRNMDGTEGPRCQSARAWGRNLSTARAQPVLFWDERLSTVAAERALLDADMSRARRSEVIDAVAASYILQGALDRMAYLAAEGK